MPVQVHLFFHRKDLFIHGPEQVCSQKGIYLIDHTIHEAHEIIDFSHFLFVVSVGIYGKYGIGQAAFQDKVGRHLRK